MEKSSISAERERLETMTLLTSFNPQKTCFTLLLSQRDPEQPLAGRSTEDKPSHRALRATMEHTLIMKAQALALDLGMLIDTELELNGLRHE